MVRGAFVAGASGGHPDTASYTPYAYDDLSVDFVAALFFHGAAFAKSDRPWTFAPLAGFSRPPIGSPIRSSIPRSPASTGNGGSARRST